MPLKIYDKKLEKSPVIGIAAGKGGVGKSSFTALFALALNQQGYRVGILDADLYGPSIRKMLPEDQGVSKDGQHIIPAVSRGIKLISMGFFRKEDQASVVRAPIANGIITQFLKQVHWGKLDVLLIDFPPGTGDIQITLAQQGDLSGAVMITTPQEIALMDVKKCIHMFQQVNIPVIGIIENMSYYQPSFSEEKIYLFGKGGGEKLAHGSQIPYLGSIPVDPLISETLDQGVSLFNYQNDHASKLQSLFLNLSQKIMNSAEKHQQNSEGDIGSFNLIWKEMNEP